MNDLSHKNHPHPQQIIAEELLDKKQACEALGGIGNTKFYQLLNEGELFAVKIGKRLMVRRSEINRYILKLPTYKSEVVGA